LQNERKIKIFFVEERKFFLPNMLTRDVLSCVLAFVPFKEFLQMRLVSKTWNNAAMNCIWQWDNLLKKKDRKRLVQIHFTKIIDFVTRAKTSNITQI